MARSHTRVGFETDEKYETIEKMQRASLNVVTKSGGLAIKTSSSPTVKTAAATNYIVDTAVGSFAAGDMDALVGTVATAKVGLWAFVITSAGATDTVAITLTEDTAAAAVGKLYDAYDLKSTETDTNSLTSTALLGFVIVANATGSNFVGGTTALDTANLTVTYVDTPCWNPSIYNLP